jgi:diguanylate cyclase (GGDEF)-like protein
MKWLILAFAVILGVASAVVIQGGSNSLWLATHAGAPLQIGNEAEATGFPHAHHRLLTLTGGEIRNRHILRSVSPQPATLRQLAFGSTSRPDGHLNDLVSIEGQFVTQVREAARDEYVLVSDGKLFIAIYRHPPGAALQSMRQIPPGTRIRVTGISMIEDPKPITPGGELPSIILMRNADDITVVARPSLLSVRNLLLLVGLLLASVVVVGARGWAIEYKVRRQTAAMALIEQRRSRILEEINGSRPLVEIIEEITKLVSFKLHGVPCWCQVADGAQLGNRPRQLKGLRVVQCEIPAHTGAALGAFFAAFDAHAKPSANESEALSMAVALTALTIETRRLYTDLRNRSEFDVLTKIHNRFSLDKYLDRLIEEARETAGVFGLIYIDLDKFKQVNDIYGHQFGDQYLQEAALRMKRQLRGMDMLARLGGDEFAALLPSVRTRAKVEEIALRLERCFQEPFVIEGQALNGSASIGIALYPENGANKDELFSTADAAMYGTKRAKHAAR